MIAAAAAHRDLDFELPSKLEASEPPEARGVARDGVRLLVSSRVEGRIVHARFHDLARFLDPGDLLVVNTSGTMNAALPAAGRNGTRLELHLSTRLPKDLWAVELRVPGERGTEPFFDAVAGDRLSLPAGGRAILHLPRARARRRLWTATVEVPGELPNYLEQHGAPIRYGYVERAWPAEAYQTVYAIEKGSAEMPSAGRPFTPELVTRLIAAGVQLAPLVLHAGVASLEHDEPPYDERYRVPPATAALVNAARRRGGRVVAVGTTVVRALETVTDFRGVTHPGDGWTSLVVTPRRGVHAISGLLTGFHEPRATHLALLEAVAGSGTSAGRAGLDLVRDAYREALGEGYLWHEFGDSHLILADRSAPVRARRPTGARPAARRRSLASSSRPSV